MLSLLRRHLHAVLLLAVLVSSVALAPLLDAVPEAQLVIALATTVPMWASISWKRSEQERPRRRRVGLVLLVLLSILLLAFVLTRARVFVLVSAGLGCFGYALASAFLLRHAFGRDRDQVGRLLDAVNAFLLVGFTYVALYAILDHVLTGGFEHGSSRSHVSWGELVYFSFSTLTTTGYGDVLPRHPLVRGVASLEQISGVLYTAALIGRIFALSSPPTAAAAPKIDADG